MSNRGIPGTVYSIHKSRAEPPRPQARIGSVLQPPTRAKPCWLFQTVDPHPTHSRAPERRPSLSLSRNLRNFRPSFGNHQITQITVTVH